MQTIEVVEYDPAWPGRFEQLRSRVWPAVKDCAIAVEHVGSTSVPWPCGQASDRYHHDRRRGQ
jgi:GrpB-like predicted nucleotidyltransferase (UPF0157 family)